MAEELSSQTFLFDVASGGRTKTDRMAENEGLCQAGATAHCCVIATEACKPFWRQRSRTDDAQNIVGGGIITKLPDDVLTLVLQHMDFQEKCTMQLVCRKFSALLSNPPPGLWGEVNLVLDIINMKNKGNVSRWFIRRLQGFARIICDTSEDYEINPSALLILMAKLSGAFSRGTDLTILLTPDLTKEFLQGLPTGPPDRGLLDYWATMSSCLTDLEVSMNPRDKRLLQPACLNELTRLTRLVFEEDGSLAVNMDRLRYAFELPELKVLEVNGLWASDLELQCSQLRTLHIEVCTIGKLYLQASLEYLHNEFSNPIVLHEGFPVTNLIGLTYLHLEDDDAMEMEAVLFHGLPLMSRLRNLSLSIHTCSLPARLPRSLQKSTLGFGIARGWDSLVIPLVQQLPRVESIRLYPFPSQQSGSFGDKSLDHDLRPFLGMKELKLLQLGKPDSQPKSRVWKASALRQLGELEAEVVRLGKNLEIKY